MSVPDRLSPCTVFGPCIWKDTLLNVSHIHQLLFFCSDQHSHIGDGRVHPFARMTWLDDASCARGSWPQGWHRICKWGLGRDCRVSEKGNAWMFGDLCLRSLLTYAQTSLCPSACHTCKSCASLGKSTLHHFCAIALGRFCVFLSNVWGLLSCLAMGSCCLTQQPADSSDDHAASHVEENCHAEQ